MGSKKEYTVIKDEKTSEYILIEDYYGHRVETRYVQVRSPYSPELWQLLWDAMGTSSDIVEFAWVCSDKKACPKNTHKISPYVFKKIHDREDIIRPLKPEVIQALLNNTRDPMAVSPDKIFPANGFIAKELVDSVEKQAVSPDDARKFITLKSRAGNDILRRLNNETHSVSLLRFDSERHYKEITDRYGTYGKYGVNAVVREVFSEKDGGKGEWYFFIDDTEPDEIVEIAGVVGRYYELFFDLNFANKREEIKLEKNRGYNFMVSFVCQNAGWYNCAVKELEDVEVDGYMSVVLIQNSKIVAEHTLKQLNGKRPECVFFENEEIKNGDEGEGYTSQNDGYFECRKNSLCQLEKLYIPSYGY